MNLIGARISVLRAERGLTQQQLADATGIKRYDIGKIEIGKRKASATDLAYIAEALGVAPEAVLDTSEPKVMFRLSDEAMTPGSQEAIDWFERYVDNWTHVSRLVRGIGD